MSWPDHRKLRWQPTLRVEADDGTALAVELLGDRHPGPSVVFTHGWTLTSRSWYYQRALAERYRLVLWDHRGHGESDPGPRHNRTIEQLGRDLRRVLDATAENREVVLVGHSMGGMTIMALAAQHPELFGGRVRAVALVDTSARTEPLSFGLPARLSSAVERSVRAQMDAMASERTRLRTPRAGSRLSLGLTRFLNFGRGVDRRLVAYVDAMTASTPPAVVGDFYRTLDTHDQTRALGALARVDTLVVVGGRDRLTPPDQSRLLASAVPGARLIELAGAEHSTMLERPGDVNASLEVLVERASRPRRPGGRAVPPEAGVAARRAASGEEGSP